MQPYTSSVPGRSMCEVGEFVELSILGGYIGEAWRPNSNVSFSRCSHLDSIYTETLYWDIYSDISKLPAHQSAVLRALIPANPI